MICGYVKSLFSGVRNTFDHSAFRRGFLHTNMQFTTTEHAERQNMQATTGPVRDNQSQAATAWTQSSLRYWHTQRLSSESGQMSIVNEKRGVGGEEGCGGGGGHALCIIMRCLIV